MLFFFFKQKTAYEMRISDWSSDVCSSDLILTITVALTFIVELHSFSLPIELIALPLVTMLVMMAEVAKHQPEHAAEAQFLDTVAALIGFGYVGFSLWMSYIAWQETATWANALEFLIPLLLSIGVLPFLYAWIIYVTYNDVQIGRAHS